MFFDHEGDQTRIGPNTGHSHNRRPPLSPLKSGDLTHRRLTISSVAVLEKGRDTNLTRPIDTKNLSSIN